MVLGNFDESMHIELGLGQVLFGSDSYMYRGWKIMFSKTVVGDFHSHASFNVLNIIFYILFTKDQYFL